jgi:hypothetical protein
MLELSFWNSVLPGCFGLHNRKGSIDNGYLDDLDNGISNKITTNL